MQLMSISRPNVTFFKLFVVFFTGSKRSRVVIKNFDIQRLFKGRGVFSVPVPVSFCLLLSSPVL